MMGFRNAPGNSDFRYIWMAGNFWLHGFDPYGPSYSGSRVPGVTQLYPLRVWLYPPHWILIAVPLAAVPFLKSFALWLACTTLLCAGSVTALWKLAAGRQAL